MKYIKGADIITETQVLENHVLGFDTQFHDIIPSDKIDLTGVDVIDGEGLFVAPGLIDMHIHGCGGKDTMDGTNDALKVISASIVKNGVTSFLATTMTMARDKISRSLCHIGKMMKEELPGAQLIGAHLEGPFISPEFKGAQNLEYIIDADWQLIEPYRDIIKIVTLAPERQGAMELIEKLKEGDIIASMGHTAASYEEAIAGIDAGISHCTHLFNAMTGIHHRKPGAVPAALSGNIYCELLADKIHIHYGLFEFARKAIGVDRIVLITDCMEAGGMGEGIYNLGGQRVFVNKGEARLTDGALAGSVAALNQCLYNFYKHTNTKLQDVFKMASLNPAVELNIADHKGSITSGKDADFILIDRDFNVKSTYIGGRCRFKQ